MIALRREHPIFRRRDFFTGEAAGGSATKDIVWLKPDGVEMTPEEWDKDFARCLGVYLAGDALAETDRVAAAGARRELPDALQRASRCDRVQAAGARSR